jgi:DNA-directed RNA polymerase subunit H (RpoH/RPB5)
VFFYRFFSQKAVVFAENDEILKIYQFDAKKLQKIQIQDVYYQFLQYGLH